MGFALIFVGVLMAVSAVRGTHSDLFALVKSDFTGPANFMYWLVIVLIVGSIGYIKPLQPLTRAFLVIIVLALLLTKGDPAKAPGGGLFAQLFRQIGSTDTANVNPSNVPGTAAPVPAAIAPLAPLGGLTSV
jgi:hypothetical protein